MEFEDSGLPSDSRIQEAFSYAYTKFRAEVADKLRQFFTKQLSGQEAWFQEKLNADLEEKKITQEEYDQKQKAIKLQSERTINRAVERNLQEGFTETIVKNAKAVEASSTSLIIVMLLGNFMRSVKDYFEIEGKFGTPVAQALADIQHIEMYPDESQKTLEKAGSLTKQTFVTNAILQFEEIKESLQENPKQGHKGALHFEDEQALFSNMKAVYGTDPALDKRLVDAFNAVGKMMNPPCQMEIGADNKPNFVKDESKNSPKSSFGNKSKKKPGGPSHGGN